MSWLGTLLGGGAGAVIDSVGAAVDELVTSDEERLALQARLEELRQQPHLGQIETNKIEAAHRTVFVAGWRPAVGWVCAFALAWHFVGFDLASWSCRVFWPDVAPPALRGTADLVSVVMALLGLGGLRTFEKLSGRTR